MASRVTMQQVRADLADVVNRARYRGERFVLEKRGRLIAAVVPIADLEKLEGKSIAAPRGEAA